MAKYKFVKSVMDVGRISPRILYVVLVLFEKVLTIIFVHGPQNSQSEEDRDRFYNCFSAEMQSKNGNYIALGDFFRHVGSSINGIWRSLWRKNNKDIVGFPCILGIDRHIKVSVKGKIKVWKEYEKKLLNEENECIAELNVEKKGAHKENVCKSSYESSKYKNRKNCWTK